jgi:oligoendopeptidase F
MTSPSHAVPSVIPTDLDASQWPAIEPLANELLGRCVESAGDLEAWLLDRSELDAACSESRALLYINMTCHTDQESASGAWERYVEHVAPPLKRVSFELDTRQHELCERFSLDAQRYSVIVRDTRAAIEIFRDENVPLQTRTDKLDQQYDKARGEQTVEFEGKTRTMPQMARYYQSTDCSLRERAWVASARRMLEDVEQIDGIYDEMISVRHQIALNAGFENYRDYAFRAKLRFDYTPSDCIEMHRAVETHCVPFVEKLDRRRAERLGSGALKPWDLSVDELGRDPLRPFETGQQLVEKTRRVFERLDPQLAQLFATMGDNAEPFDSLDLDSRKGKAPGGYQYMRDRSRKPFIFMNAAGLHRDVETMVHEAGHAFHSLLSKDEPLMHYRDAPIEFAEVASMTMELLTMPYWGEYYPSEEEADRARRKQLEGTISLLPWIATIDAFQHWVYTNPGHSGAERTACWHELDSRFGRKLAWGDHENVRSTQWQKQGHLFGVPFYYIEYGIAQLGALGIYLRSKKEGLDVALSAYKDALAVGGSRPLPQLFEAAGVPFDFSSARIGELVGAVEAELATLPE